MIVSVDNLAALGIITDQLPMQLPPNAWSGGQNIRFRDNKVVKSLGHEEYYDTGLNWDGGTGEQVYFAIPYNDGTTAYWVYCGLNDVRVTDGTTDKEITRSVGGDYSATASRNWTGGILGDILILNNGIDDPQSWDGDFATPSTLADLANWPASTTCGTMRVYKNYLVALDIVKSGTRYKSLVKWSDSAALGAVPGSWDETDPTTDAGETDLSEKTKDVNVGAVIDCMPLRDTNIVYTDSQVWAMDFVGGTFVFNFRQIFKNNGLLTRRCVREFEGKHFVVGNGDVYVHDGNTFTSIIENRRKRFLFSDIDGANYEKTYVFANYPETEMWICYAADGAPQGLPNKALIWNWRLNTWGIRDLPNDTAYGTPHISSGVVDTQVASDAWTVSDGSWDSGPDDPWDLIGFNPQEQSPLIAADKLYKGDSTNTFDGEMFVSRIERIDIPLGENDQMMRIKAVYPKMEGSDPINVYVGSHLAPGKPVVYSTPVTFTPGTNIKVDARRTGTHAAVKFESTGDQDWQLIGYDLEIEPAGRR